MSIGPMPSALRPSSAAGIGSPTAFHESAGGYQMVVVVDVLEGVVVGATVVVGANVVLVDSGSGTTAAMIAELAPPPSPSMNTPTHNATRPTTSTSGMSHHTLLRLGFGGSVHSSKSNLSLSSLVAGEAEGGGAEGSSAVAGADAAVAVMAAVASSTLTSIHGLPQSGHSVSSAGRAVPQWIQTGRLDEVLVTIGGYVRTPNRRRLCR